MASLRLARRSSFSGASTVRDNDAQELLIPRRRARTFESSFTDPEYDAFVHSELERGMSLTLPAYPRDEPVHFIDRTQLTLENVRYAFWYAHFRIKNRSVTPRSRAFLEIYREAASDRMSRPSDDNSARMITHSKTLFSQAFLRKIPDPVEQEAYASLKQLQLLQFYNTYGDYFPEMCSQFSKKAEKLPAEINSDRMLIDRYWVDVQQDIEREDESWKVWEDRGKPGRAPPTKVINFINDACYHCNYDREYIYWCIEKYAARNSTCHNGIRAFIKDLNFKALAEHLHRDARQLGTLFQGDRLFLMGELFRNVREKYYLEIEENGNYTLTDEALKMQRVRQDKRNARACTRRKAAEAEALKAKKAIPTPEAIARAKDELERLEAEVGALGISSQ